MSLEDNVLIAQAFSEKYTELQHAPKVRKVADDIKTYRVLILPLVPHSDRQGTFGLTGHPRSILHQSLQKKIGFQTDDLIFWHRFCLASPLSSRLDSP